RQFGARDRAARVAVAHRPDPGGGGLMPHRTVRIEGEGFELLVEARNGYLRAQVNGSRDTLEISLGYWREIARECHERGATRLLVVENISEPGNSVDLERLIDGIVA